jgi:hypothetical protein
MGRTVTGGSIGMAALEGYAAAIEVLYFARYAHTHTARSRSLDVRHPQERYQSEASPPHKFE